MTRSSVKDPGGSLFLEELLPRAAFAARASSSPLKWISRNCGLVKGNRRNALPN
jgi:hypothetical protein